MKEETPEYFECLQKKRVAEKSAEINRERKRQLTARARRLAGIYSTPMEQYNVLSLYVDF